MTARLHAAASRAVAWLLSRFLPTASSGGARNGDGPRRILFVLSIYKLGDLLFMLGAVRGVAEAHPDARIDVIARHAALDLFRGLSFIDRVLPMRRDRIDARLIRTVFRRGPYDAVVHVHWLDPVPHVSARTVGLLLASRAPVRIGYEHATDAMAYTHRIADPEAAGEHMLDYCRRLVGPLIPEARTVDVRPVLPLFPEERAWAESVWTTDEGSAPRVLLNVSVSPVGGWSRRWPMENYAAVAEHIRHVCPRARLVVLGANDREAAEALAARVGGYAPDTSLREMIALVASADLVLTPATAVEHVAAIFDRPLVALHCRGDEEFHPFNPRGRAVVGPIGLSLQGLRVAAVTDAVDAALRSGWRCTVQTP